MKTIKQIADELGVSKQAVRDEIAKQGLQSSLQKNGNQFAIDEKQETLIKSAFRVRMSAKQNEKTLQSETQSEAIVDVLLKQSEMLQKELAMKNEQIYELQKALENTTEALASAQESVKAAQLLQARAEQKLELLENKSDEPEKKKGFLKRWFG